MKITISEFKRKYPKLIRLFEKETGKHAILKNGKITKQFKYWLQQKIKYKDGFICKICGREFDNKRALISHKWSHNKKLREETNKKIGDGHRGKSHSEETKRKMSEAWNRPDYRKKMSGENSSRFGKQHTKETKQKIRDGNIGKKSPNWKGDNVGYHGIHQRVRNKKIKPKNCEICGLPEYYGNLGRIELSNIRNHQYTDNPGDYQYIHQNCHKKYDSYN